MSKLTYDQFTRVLAGNGCYYYRANVTLHSYITSGGAVRFYANYQGDESKAYNSLKNLMQEEGYELPAHEEIKDYLKVMI